MVVLHTCRESCMGVVFSSRRRHTRCALVTGVQTCALPIFSAAAILASNTSSIPITRLAQAAPDPARFIGVHFFNPVPVMGLIELIRGLATSDDTLAKVEAHGRVLGKEIVHANDAPGFIVNRVLMPMNTEAVYALGDGVATIQNID